MRTLTFRPRRRDRAGRVRPGWHWTRTAPERRPRARGRDHLLAWPERVLGDRLTELIIKFNGSHKVQVNAQFQGTYDQLYQKVVSAIKAGSVPDLAMVSGPTDACPHRPPRLRSR